MFTFRVITLNWLLLKVSFRLFWRFQFTFIWNRCRVSLFFKARCLPFKHAFAIFLAYCLMWPSECECFGWWMATVNKIHTKKTLKINDYEGLAQVTLCSCQLANAYIHNYTHTHTHTHFLYKWVTMLQHHVCSIAPYICVHWSITQALKKTASFFILYNARFWNNPAPLHCNIKRQKYTQDRGFDSRQLELNDKAHLNQLHNDLELQIKVFLPFLSGNAHRVSAS